MAGKRDRTDEAPPQAGFRVLSRNICHHRGGVFSEALSMGHNVTGLISNCDLLERFSARYKLHRPTSLACGLAILALRDEDIDAFIPSPMSGHADGFVYLSQQLAAVLCSASAEGAVMYFETEYFGGVGTQGAAVYQLGACIFGPESADFGPINRGLALLGVRTQPPAYDEFATVGLHRHRSSEDWIEEAGG